MRSRDDPHLKREMSYIRQIYSAIIVSCLCLNIGILFAWPSSTLKLFSSANTTLNRPMTETEISLFGSLPSFTALFSTPLSGVLLDVIGRKNCCILFGLPSVIAWTIVCLVARVEVILASVCVGGLSGCLLLITPNFISEFTHESIRGTLTSFGIIFYGIGLMVSYILGGCLNYEMMNYVCLTISVLSLLMMSLVKESPVYLMSKDLEKKAAESIAFYRSSKQGSLIVQQEMESIRRTLNVEMNRGPAEEQMLKSSNGNPKKPVWLQFFKKSKSTRRGLAIVLILFSLSIFQGLIVVQVYSEPLFKEALPNMSANLTSILFALLNTISGFVAAYLLDFFGRRPVMIYPSLGTCFFCIALGTQIQFHWGPGWLKGLFVYAFCITATCGAGTVPYVMIPEMFLPEVRGIITMLVIEWGWLCNFFILFIFNPFIAVAGLGPVFYVFAFMSLASALFCKHYLPETKGLTVDAIQNVLLVT